MNKVKRYRNLGEALTEVGKTFAFEQVSHVIVAWEDDKGNTRNSLLPWGSFDDFTEFIARLTYFLEHPDKVKAITTDLSEYRPREN